MEKYNSLNGNFFFPAVFCSLLSAWQRKFFLLIASLILLLFLSIPASAAVEEFVARADDGAYSKFSYDELLNSYALQLIGKEGKLYEEFKAKEIVALKITGHGYFDYKDILDHYAGLVKNGEEFDLLQYAGNGTAKQVELPAEVKPASNPGKKVPAGGADTDSDNQEEKDEEPGSDRASENEEENEEEKEEDNSSDEGSNDEEKQDEEKKDNEDDPEPGTSGIGTPILDQAEVTVEDAVSWAQANRAEQEYIDVASLYWEYGEKTGIRPEVLYAQAAYETGFGRFGGQVPPEYNNWAGIKKGGASGDEPEDHEEFASPEEGVRAHFNHMSAYVGISPVGETHDRYDSVLRLPWAGTVETVEDLSGKWAPSASYHERIVEMIGEMEK